MTFQTVQINVAGPSYKDISRPLASQETRNFFPELSSSGKSQFVSKSFPGLTEFGSTTAGVDYGSTEMAGTVYRVVGSTLYSVNSTGLHTSIGTVNTTGTYRCIFANDGINLFIVTGSSVYQYNGSTLTTVTDADIIGAKSVDFINSQFLYTKDTLTTVSDPGDGSSASGLNAIGEETDQDKLVRDYVFDQVIYRFGEKTTPSWYNSGVGNPPITRIEGQTISVGLAAIHAVTNTVDYMYWIGSDRNIYRLRGGVAEPVSTPAISHAFESYTFIEDAILDTFVLSGNHIVVITLPTENKTWALIESLERNGWFELSSGVDGGRYNISSIVSAYGKILLTDVSNGKIYKLDKSNYTLDGDVFQRRRVIASINSKLLGTVGKRVQMSRFELILETGTGLTTGTGVDPRIMIEWSTDGGKSWGQGTWMRIGRLGETDIRAEWFSMMSFYDLMIRITTSDPVAYHIYEGAIDLRLAGR